MCLRRSHKLLGSAGRQMRGVYRHCRCAANSTEKSAQQIAAEGARKTSGHGRDLKLPDASYDRALVFFLLHEQPHEWRAHTLTEVIRVVKPHGKIVIVDYARPRWWHPLRYFFPLVLGTLEPFALDLWREEITSWLPELCAAGARKRLFFGGLYQLVTSWR